MNGRTSQIGFSSQRIRYQWMVQTASWLLAGLTRDEVKSELLSYLAGWLADTGSSARSSRDKAATILLRTWIMPDVDLTELRNDGRTLLESLPNKDQIAVHWGMITATYPYWGSVANSAGRLLRLQGFIEAVQIQRRLKEKWGDRELVARATRNVIRSFIDWGVLTETDDKGVYKKGDHYSIQDPKLIAWLVEASLCARADGSAIIEDLLDGTSLFPFQLARVSAERIVSFSPRLDLLRHGLDENLLMLRKGFGTQGS